MQATIALDDTILSLSPSKFKLVILQKYYSRISFKVSIFVILCCMDLEITVSNEGVYKRDRIT